MDDEELYIRARKRVEAKIAFFIHAGIYICINALLIGINLIVTPDRDWFIWPLVGWGIGLFFHGMTVYFVVSGGRMKGRMIEREYERQEAREATASGVPAVTRDQDDANY